MYDYGNSTCEFAESPVQEKTAGHSTQKQTKEWWVNLAKFKASLLIANWLETFSWFQYPTGTL